MALEFPPLGPHTGHIIEKAGVPHREATGLQATRDRASPAGRQPRAALRMVLSVALGRITAMVFAASAL